MKTAAYWRKLLFGILFFASTIANAASMILLPEEGQIDSMTAVLVSTDNGDSILAFYESSPTIDYVATLFADINEDQAATLSYDSSLQLDIGYLIADTYGDDLIAALISGGLQSLVVYHAFIDYSLETPSYQFVYQVYNLAQVPLPAALLLFITGMFLLFGFKGSRKHRMISLGR